MNFYQSTLAFAGVIQSFPSVRFARPYGIVLRTHDGYKNITIADMLDTQGAFRSRADVIAMHKPGWVQLRKSYRAVDWSTDRAKEAQIVQLTTQTKTVAATHWSTRSLAKVVRVSDTMLYRVSRQYELKPHIVRDFKVSRDSKSIEKLEDIVGLYMSPPEHALVLCCDLGTGAGTYAAWSAMKKGRAATKPHD